MNRGPTLLTVILKLNQVLFKILVSTSLNIGMSFNRLKLNEVIIEIFQNSTTVLCSSAITRILLHAGAS